MFGFLKKKGSEPAQPAAPAAAQENISLEKRVLRHTADLVMSRAFMVSEHDQLW